METRTQKILVPSLVQKAGKDLTQEDLARLVHIYEMMLGTTDDFVYIFDPQGRFLYANPRLLKVWAKTLDQVIGKTCHDLGYPTWHADMHMREIEQIVRDKTAIRGEVPFTGDSGIFGVYDYIFKPVLDDKGEVDIIVGTTRDVTERKQNEEKLKAVQDELRRANEHLGDRATHLESIVQQRTRKLSETIGDLEAFSYSISHDMRAPLRSMTGFSDILVEEHAAQLDAQGLDYLKRISNAARRMDLLIQDVLSFSRLSAAEITLAPVPLDALVRDVIRSYPNLQSDRVANSIAPGLPIVLGNETLLTQCVANLLDNAAKFAKPGENAVIKIAATPTDGRTRLLVQDNGIGIPAESLTRIFEIFHRVDRDHEGTGIGLAIVRKAVEKMGGTVGVESEVDQDSLFWLELATTPAS